MKSKKRKKPKKTQTQLAEERELRAVGRQEWERKQWVEKRNPRWDAPDWKYGMPGEE
tara:strand:- start:692 stop:862 length:171 start_codon:yes stop_codon:yes gene_type:complete